MGAALAVDMRRDDRRVSGGGRRVSSVTGSAAPDADLFGRGPDRRGHLRLVPGGSETASTQQRAVSVRLTRAGRMVRAGVVVGVAVAALGLGVGAVQALADGDNQVTVQPGQTMWQVAAHELPQLPTPEAVARIQLANGLNSAEVHAGQVLQIP